LKSEFGPVLIIAKREIKDQFRDWRIVFPIIGLTIFFPFLMNFTANSMLDFVERYGASIIGERLVPFLMMIVGFFPISVSLVIALESFVGEKERGSIEPLLNTPLKDWQLYVGKLLSSTVPPLVGSFLGMSVYCIGLVINQVPLPEPTLMIQIVALTIVQAIVMVSGGVVVSSQATSVKAANLLSSFIVIPMALLIQGESIVMFWGDFGTLWWAVFGLSILALLLIRVGLAHFNREELLGREIDVLNFRWGWKTFIHAFTGSSHTVIDWYKKEVFESLKKIRVAFWITLLITLICFWIGSRQIDQFNFSFNTSDIQEMEDQIRVLFSGFTAGGVSSVLAVFWRNFRVLIISSILGLFSFGILGAFPLIATVGIGGYLMSLLQYNGIEVGVYLFGFILPHGIFEIPAAIIATAALIYGGAVLATPDSSHTIGEVSLKTLADWCKLMVGIVIPLLFLSAMIEVWVTPNIALALLFS